MFGIELPVFAIVLIALFVFSTIKILNEYERGVIFLLGRFWKVKGPGIIIVIPGIQRMVPGRLENDRHGRPDSGRHLA